MITTQPSVSISGTTATVSWVFPGGTVNVYIVQYVLSSEGFTSLSVRNTTSDGTQRSVRIDNLQPFSSYSLRVAVQNNDGTSGFSPVASFSTETSECKVGGWEEGKVCQEKEGGHCSVCLGSERVVRVRYDNSSTPVRWP